MRGQRLKQCRASAAKVLLSGNWKYFSRKMVMTIILPKTKAYIKIIYDARLPCIGGSIGGRDAASEDSILETLIHCSSLHKKYSSYQIVSKILHRGCQHNITRQAAAGST